MKFLAIVGSPRKKGNTDILVDEVLKGVQKEGAHETEKIYLRDLNFSGCTGCEGCQKSHKCVLPDDMQRIHEKIDACDGLILASPTYFYNVTGLTKLFLDRLYIYNYFHSQDRSVWLNPNEITGLKYAVTVAVCEQEDEADMGFTSEAMSKTLSAVGFRCVANLKVLHAFKKGEVLKNSNSLTQATAAGLKLARTASLGKTVKDKL